MEGKLIRLRPIQNEDVFFLNTWKNDEEVYKYLGGGYQPISVNQQEKWMDSLIDLTGNNRRFIIETFDQKAIGMIGLYGINWIHRTCEIGAYIGEKSEHGKGMATEACSLIENYASKYLNLRKITLKVVEVNIAGVRFWEKMGYTTVGTLHEERFIDGEYCNVLIMEKFIQI